MSPSKPVECYTSLPPRAPGFGRSPRAGSDRRDARPARFAHPEPTEPGSVRCELCAHRCLVRPGRWGICATRFNRDGELFTASYGQVAALHVEPIEKKPLYHVLPGTRACSLATPGCTLHCDFCQNWELAQASREGTQPPVRSMAPRELVQHALRAGARSIAYTYTEPTVFFEFVLDTAALAARAGLLNVLVTNGYLSREAIAAAAPLIAAANVDLKGFSDAFYRRVCGGRLVRVLDGLVAMRQAGIWVEVTTLLIPDRNDAPGELHRLAAWIVAELGAETPWHVSRFFPAYRMAFLPPTPLAGLTAAAEAGRQAGLKHVYCGNAPELGSDDTRCAGCSAVLLRREGYRVTVDRLVAGACPECGRRLAGVGLSAGR
jgi:pyruvate formate lyase activating enzyme